mmetsp:Transcript_2232/g.7354  ORF Transcript_2232/g.7354 Transcript_2232/m.7354 type:complete len:226 (-) Transcript_2232:262-939(-)
MCTDAPESEGARSAESRAPLGSVVEPRGSSSSALAPVHESSRDEICRPVEVATRPLFVTCSVARWYSGRSGSSRKGEAETTGTRRGSGCGRPHMRRSAGATVREKQTRALTGLPGRPKTSRGRLDAPTALEAADGRGTVANVSGLPGFITTRSKCSVPRAARSAPSKSRSPIETPPVQTRASQPRRSASSSFAASDAASSRAMPKSMPTPPSAAVAASSAGRFES